MRGLLTGKSTRKAVRARSLMPPLLGSGGPVGEGADVIVEGNVNYIPKKVPLYKVYHSP